MSRPKNKEKEKATKGIFKQFTILRKKYGEVALIYACNKYVMRRREEIRLQKEINEKKKELAALRKRSKR